MAMYLTLFVFLLLNKTPLYECTGITFCLSMKLMHILIISILGSLRTMSYVLFFCVDLCFHFWRLEQAVVIIVQLPQGSRRMFQISSGVRVIRLSA